MRGLALALVIVLGAGCATSQINQGRQGIVAGVHVFTTGADALEAARQAEEDGLIKKVQAGELTPDQAESQYRGWMAKGKKAATALVTLWDLIKTASAVLGAADAKITGDVPSAMADVLAALSNAAQALADVGVHLPGVN